MFDHSKQHYKIHECTYCTFVTSTAALLQSHAAVHTSFYKGVLSPTALIASVRCEKSQNNNSSKRNANTPTSVNTSSKVLSIPGTTRLRISAGQTAAIVNGSSSNTAEHKCDNCPYVTETLNLFEGHCQIHSTPARLYPCPLCTFRSVQWSFLSNLKSFSVIKSFLSTVKSFTVIIEGFSKSLS